MKPLNIIQYLPPVARLAGLTAMIVILAWASSLSQSTQKVRVFIFLAADCPCVYNHQETFNSLVREFGDRVTFKAVFTDPNDDKEEIEDMLKNLGWSISYRVDRNKTYRKKYHPKMTTECVLVSADGTIVYRGAVDDGPLNAGMVRQFFLKMALEDYFNKVPVRIKEGKTIGCLIS